MNNAPYGLIEVTVQAEVNGERIKARKFFSAGLRDQPFAWEVIRAEMLRALGEEVVKHLDPVITEGR